MRIYDNHSPQGRRPEPTIDPFAVMKEEQQRAFVRGTSPQCPRCGHWTRPHNELQDTPLDQMRPTQPGWEAQSIAAVQYLARRRVAHAQLGDRYVCHTPKCGWTTG